MTNLEKGYNLLESLGIQHILIAKDHFELRHDFDNKGIIAYGKTEEELVENFYYLYEKLQDGPWKN